MAIERRQYEVGETPSAIQLGIPSTITDTSSSRSLDVRWDPLILLLLSPLIYHSCISHSISHRYPRDCVILTPLPLVFRAKIPLVISRLLLFPFIRCDCLVQDINSQTTMGLQ